MLSNVKYPNNMQNMTREKQSQMSRDYEDKCMSMTSKVDSLVKFLEEERL